SVSGNVTDDFTCKRWLKNLIASYICNEEAGEIKDDVVEKIEIFKIRMKRIILTVFILLQLTFVVANSQSLNGIWQFAPDYFNEGTSQEWYLKDKSFSDSLPVPGTWSTNLAYAEYIGKAWYKTTFTAPENWTNKKLILNFEGVYNECEVWLNGKKIGNHDFGFVLFKFDISDLVKVREENTLALVIDNTFKLGATWNWGGIRRSVWVDVFPYNFIDDVKISSNINLNSKRADISLDVNVKAYDVGKQKNEVRLKVYNPKGVLVVDKKQSFVLQEGNNSIKVGGNIKNIDLWHFNKPQLYTCEVELLQNRNTIHMKNERFGLRKVEIVGEEFRLNGENVRLVGTNWVPDDRFTGNTLPLSRIKEDVDLMKSLGVNMARLSHLALPKDALDYLDEKGIMIFEEIPLWNKNVNVTASNPVAFRWLKSLVNERYNHPCIIGWSVGNEIGRLTDNPDVRGYVASAIEHVKTLDPSRIALYVTHTAVKQEGKEPVELCDMILFNQYGAYGERADAVHKYYPEKPLFFAEYGRKPNSEDPNMGIIDFDVMLNMMRGRNYLIGASAWTFNDYRSNYVSGTNPTENRCWGVVNVYRQKKRAFKTMQREYLPVKNFLVKLEGNTGIVSMSPREKYDIPAYNMSGYSISYIILDSNGSVDTRKVIDLPNIQVGSSKPVSVKLDIQKKQNALWVELLDPQGYSVYDTIIYFKVPVKPIIGQVYTSVSEARIHFASAPLAHEYYAVYSELPSGVNPNPEQKVIKTKPTINNFIEISGGFEYGKKYRISLVATNTFGESIPSEEVTFMANEHELPPIVWYSGIQSDMLCIGYESEVDDFIYDIKYGLDPNNMTQIVSTRQRGAVMLPLLEKDKKHYVSMRKRIRYGYAGEWTQIEEVK
ncbi:MAG: beta galactosidase jelly roll domain-containing protein, partial [Prevotellaceae bacterium]|nr:beta galactosidase jelly roll domain-containing protein [Prevotellaceae bacterium]